MDLVRRWIQEYAAVNVGRQSSMAAREAVMQAAARYARHPMMAGKRLLVEPHLAHQTVETAAM
jgi:hypothetical protein